MRHWLTVTALTRSARGPFGLDNFWFSSSLHLKEKFGSKRSGKKGGKQHFSRSVFCYRTPDFVNGPFVALAKAKILAPSDPFLNFSFPSYGRFRGGDPPTQQKVLPHLTVRALTDSNSPSALRALALRARALRARAGKIDQQSSRFSLGPQWTNNRF